MIYQDLGNLSKALTFQQKAVNIKVAILNSQHPDIAQSYINMAGIYVHKRDLQTAKEYINKAVAILQANFPDGHPNLTNALSWQAYIDDTLQK